MQDLPQVANQLEFLFLKRLSTGLKDGILDIPTAKDVTNRFIEIKPFSSIDDAKMKMMTFSQQNTYFAQLKDYIDAYYSEQIKDNRIEQMRQHMQQGNIDQALEVAKN